MIPANEDGEISREINSPPGYIVNPILPSVLKIPSSSSSDFGEHLRKQAKKLFSTELVPVSDKADRPDITAQLDALERLASDKYNQKYPRRFTSSATGLNKDQCTQALSSEFLDYMTETDKSMLDSVNPKKND